MARRLGQGQEGGASVEGREGSGASCCLLGPSVLAADRLTTRPHVHPAQLRAGWWAPWSSLHECEQLGGALTSTEMRRVSICLKVTW